MISWQDKFPGFSREKSLGNHGVFLYDIGVTSSAARILVNGALWLGKSVNQMGNFPWPHLIPGELNHEQTPGFG